MHQNHRREKRFSEALHLMEESDSICRALGIEVGVLINQINRAELFLDQGNFEVLATTLDALGPKILALAEPSYILDYYRMRYKLYDAIGNEEQANWFYRKYKALHDEKIGDRSRSLLSEWELAQVEVEQEKDKLQLDVALSTQNPPHSHSTIEPPTTGIAENKLVITVAPQKLICPHGSTYPIKAVAIIKRKMITPEHHKCSRGCI